MRAAVMCSQGVGDGVIFSLVAYHLSLQGYEVTTFCPQLKGLQAWFPFQKFVPYLKEEAWQETIAHYDLVIIQPGALPYPKFRNLPAEPPAHIHFLFNESHDHSQTLVANLMRILQERFGILSVQATNGILPPSHLTYRKYPKRIAIHPTSGEAFRSWPLERFLKVARYLVKKGYEPVFVMSAKERQVFPEGLPFAAPVFPDLEAVAAFIYESGYFIGNDSGLGHLASSLGIPTVTLFHRKKISQFWRPGFSPSQIVLPLPLIPREKWKPRLWKHLLFPQQVIRQFEKLEEADRLQAAEN